MTREMVEPALPPALRRAIADRRVVVVAGAGISMLAPSSLPDWRGFCDALVEGAKRVAREADGADDTVRAAIGRIQLDDIGAKGMSEYVVKIIGSEFYFPVLGALDGAVPNANHRALAQMAREGSLRAIVTTNFDTLIEKAFDREGVPLQVVSEAKNYRDAATGASCTLFKIHGSVNELTSLVDTIGQKIQGLPATVRDALAVLFAEHHALVVGYSGADLEFGADYLCLTAARGSRHGLTWFLRPGTDVSLLLQHAVEPEPELREFQHAELPRALARCLASAQDLEQPSAERKSPETSTPDFLTRIGSFYDYLGPSGALAMLVRMALDLGRLADADALRGLLARCLSNRPPEPLVIQGLAMRQVAFAAHARGDLPLALHWTTRETEVRTEQLTKWRSTCAAVEAKRQSGQLHDLPAPYPFSGTLAADWPLIAEQVEEDIHRLLAGCWSNRANHVVAADGLGAGAALEQSLNHCELSLSGISLVHMYAVYSTWLVICGDAVDEPLGRLAECEAAALLFGNIDTANDCALNQARLYLALGEYDAAMWRVEHVRSRISIGTTQQCRLEVARISEAVRVRRVTAPSGQPHHAFRVEVPIGGDEGFWRDRLVRAESSRDPQDLAEAFHALAAILCNTGRMERAIAITRGFEAFSRSAQRHADTSTACLLRAWARVGLEDFRSAGVDCAASVRARSAIEARLPRALLEQLEHLERPSNRADAVVACRAIIVALRQVNDDWASRIGALVRLVSKWYEASRSQPATAIPFFRVLDGLESGLGSAAETERYAGRTVEQHETTRTRVYAMLAAAQYRILEDHAGVARCLELLANAATVEQRQPQADALRAKAARYDAYARERAARRTGAPDQVIYRVDPARGATDLD